MVLAPITYPEQSFIMGSSQILAIPNLPSPHGDPRRMGDTPRIDVYVKMLDLGMSACKVIV